MGCHIGRPSNAPSDHDMLLQELHTLRGALMAGLKGERAWRHYAQKKEQEVVELRAKLQEFKLW
jgi:hypothetical protein